MNQKIILLAALLGLGLPATSAASIAQDTSQRDQDRAYNNLQEGRAMPLPEIERRIVPKMKGYQYLGPEFRGKIYRLKFLKDGRVVWVDVDAQSGKVVGRSGN